MRASILALAFLAVACTAAKMPSKKPAPTPTPMTAGRTVEWKKSDGVTVRYYLTKDGVCHAGTEACPKNP